MKPGFFDELLAYVGFTERDSAALAVALPAPAVLDAVVQRFYVVLLEHEGTRRVLQGEGVVARLQGTLREWLDTLFRGPHDAAYFEKRSRIGRTHVRIGLDQHYMFSAMALIREDLALALAGSPALVALHKLLDVELAVMLETYREERFEIEMLRESERKYRDLIDNAPEMILTIDRAGRIQHHNRTTLQILGYGEGEAPASWADLVGRDAPARAWEEVERIFDQPAGPAAEFETVFCDRAGNPKSVLVRVAGLARPPRGPETVRVFVQDTTERKQLEERMAEYARQAEEKKRLATVGQMVAGIAHEVRTPLQVITAGFDALAGAAPLDLEAELARSREGIRQIRKLIDDLLNYSKEIQLEWIEVDPASLLTSVLADLAEDLAGRRLAVERSVEPGLGRLEADPFRLKQVLLNLLRNAIEATPDGGRVGVAAAAARGGGRDGTGGGTVEFRVTDSGRGIPHHDLEKIFVPFYTTKPRGTGLGLPIVRRIVDAHGGRIEVASVPGQGTTVRIRLPRKPRPVERGTKRWPANAS